jgi:hypothetical protein
MATAIVPKSEFRKDNSITVGWATIPATTHPETGEEGWGLPGGVFCANEQYAKEYAIVLDIELRRITTHPRQLLKV